MAEILIKKSNLININLRRQVVQYALYVAAERTNSFNIKHLLRYYRDMFFSKDGDDVNLSL